LRNELLDLGVKFEMNISGIDYYVNEQCVMAVSVAFKYSDATLEAAQDEYKKGKISIEQLRAAEGDNIIMQQIRNLGLSLSYDIDLQDLKDTSKWSVGMHKNKNIHFVYLRKEKKNIANQVLESFGYKICKDLPENVEDTFLYELFFNAIKKTKEKRVEEGISLILPEIVNSIGDEELLDIHNAFSKQGIESPTPTISKNVKNYMHEIVKISLHSCS